MLSEWWWLTAAAVVCLFGGLALHLYSRRSGVKWHRTAAMALLAIGFTYSVLFMFDLLPFQR